MPFTSMIKMTKITVSDKNGKTYEIEGQIQNNMVYIYKNVPIDTGYRFSYKLSNGVEKTVVVIEPGYYGDVTMGGGFPIYQCKVQDLEEYEKSRNNTASNISITNQNGAVIIGNVNNSPISISNSFTELERKIESDGGTDKEELLDKIEKTFNSLQKRQKPIVSDIMTTKLWLDLEEIEKKYSFISKDAIEEWKKSGVLPTQREIAKKNNREETSVSRTVKDFQKKLKKEL